MPFELKQENIEPKKIRKTTKLDIFMYKYSFLVLIFFLGAILLLGFVLLLKPKYEEVMITYAQEYEKKKTEAGILKLNETKLTQFIRDFEIITDEEKKMIENLIPGKNNYELIYAEMERLIENNGLILKSVSVNHVEEDKRNVNASNSKIGKMEVEIIVEGLDYGGFKRLLFSLERSMKLIDVQEVNFEPGQFSATLKFFTYYAK